MLHLRFCPQFYLRFYLKSFRHFCLWVLIRENHPQIIHVMLHTFFVPTSILASLPAWLYPQVPGTILNFCFHHIVLWKSWFHHLLLDHFADCSANNYCVLIILELQCRIECRMPLDFTIICVQSYSSFMIMECLVFFNAYNWFLRIKNNNIVTGTSYEWTAT